MDAPDVVGALPDLTSLTLTGLRRTGAARLQGATQEVLNQVGRPSKTEATCSQATRID